jgi:hypothetical protein
MVENKNIQLSWRVFDAGLEFVCKDISPGILFLPA